MLWSREVEIFSLCGRRLLLATTHYNNDNNNNIFTSLSSTCLAFSGFVNCMYFLLANKINDQKQQQSVSICSKSTTTQGIHA